MAGIIFRKTKKVLSYLEEKPEVFAIQQITLPAVSYSQLVNECSNSCGVNPSMTQAVVTALLDRLVHYMEIGHPVKLGSFGSFKPTIRTKVSATLENLSTENVKQKLIRFTPGKDFKQMLSDMSVASASDVLDNAN